MDEYNENMVETIANLKSNEAKKVVTEQGQELIVAGGEIIYSTPLIAPTTSIARRTFTRLGSLTRYVIEFGPELAKAFVCDTSDVVRVNAIINAMSGENTVAHELHQAFCDMPLDPDWVEWARADRSLMGQAEFADFIDDHVENFVSPDGATMLEIAQTLRVNNNVAFSNKVSLTNNAVNLAYTEEIEGKAGAAGDMQIPEEFEIALPVFKGHGPWKVKARLRYRVSRGNLEIGFKLRRPDRVFDKAVDEDVIAKLEEAGIPTFMGRP
ncbi:MAG TPA: DUF2303 family protein [Wenzhouxiangella sp.]|nr:DUF2303 family protein [Wenzhouxiangella sp.]